MERRMATHATKLTYEDLLLFPEDGKRHELIAGEHFVTASPNTRHQRFVLRLAAALHGFVREHRLGEVFVAPYDVVLSRHDVVVPDVIFVSVAREGVVGPAHAAGAPDLVVEVLSPSTHRRDELLKRDVYESTGVDEYWIVDTQGETVKVFRRDGERFGRPRLLSVRDGDALATALLPGLELPLAELFGD